MCVRSKFPIFYTFAPLFTPIRFTCAPFNVRSFQSAIPFSLKKSFATFMNFRIKNRGAKRDRSSHTNIHTQKKKKQKKKSRAF